MSQRTNLKKAFKIARMAMIHGASRRVTKRTLNRQAAHLPARQRQWVIQQVHKEIHSPWMMPVNVRISTIGWESVQ